MEIVTKQMLDEFKQDLIKEISQMNTIHSTPRKLMRNNDLMNKGEGKLTKQESTKLSKMSIAVEIYEDQILGLKPFKEPETIPELVELKLFEHKMTQAKLAEEIGLAKSKVSEILNGKRKADISFLKGIHKVLKIDAGRLLEIV